MSNVLLMLALGAASSTPSQIEPVAIKPQPNVVLQWNEAALQVIRAERTPPPLAARNLAIMHAAIYDAVNAVYRTHTPYRVQAAAPPGASPETAAVVAAHRTLVALFPGQTDYLDANLLASLAALPDGAGKASGLLLGQTVAERLLDLRRGDGARRQALYTPGEAPGLWRPTPPAFKAALLPQWPALTCFCMRSGSQFRPPAPPALNSVEYVASFLEVKLLGGVDSEARTPDQTVIAYFWADEEGSVTPPGHWNRIAQTVAVERGTTLPESARLFALLNLALADAGIACWDGKYYYSYVRPVHALREADPALHPDTTPDPCWTPLITTPPFPSYASGHSTFSGAAATVLAHFFGTNDVRFTNTSERVPGARRMYASFWAAAEEAGKSRIYGGIHWEFDNREGLNCGRAVGTYVSRNFLLPQVIAEGNAQAQKAAPNLVSERGMLVPWHKRPRN